VKIVSKIAALSTAALVAIPNAAMAQTADPVNAGVTAGFAKVTDVISTATPLMLVLAGTVAAVSVAVRWVKRAG
jgi:hypothetical protein